MAKPIKGNKKPRMMKKTDGKKRQSANESENEEDCAADQCLKVSKTIDKLLGHIFIYFCLFR